MDKQGSGAAVIRGTTIATEEIRKSYEAGPVLGTHSRAEVGVLLAEIDALRAELGAAQEWQSKVIADRDAVVTHMVKRAEEVRDAAITRADEAEAKLGRLIEAARSVTARCRYDSAGTIDLDTESSNELYELGEEVKTLEVVLGTLQACAEARDERLRAEGRDRAAPAYAVLRDAAQNFVRKVVESGTVAPVPDRVWIALVQHALAEPWPLDTRYIVERAEVEGGLSVLNRLNALDKAREQGRKEGSARKGKGKP